MRVVQQEDNQAKTKQKQNFIYGVYELPELYCVDKGSPHRRENDANSYQEDAIQVF